MKALWLVPVYRHLRQLPKLLRRLNDTGLPVLLIDDGNPDWSDFPGTQVIHHPQNLGKGVAIVSGLKWAQEHGYTHAVQIDADGQHDVDDALGLLRLAEQNPLALVCGYPVFGSDAPAARSKGRKITRFFIWQETGIKGEDGMCGCRVYPVAAALEVLRRARSRRMGFDIEAVVLWLWSGRPWLKGSVRVAYPDDGFSNFRMLRDNLGFFALHSRLCSKRLFDLAAVLLTLPLWLPILAVAALAVRFAMGAPVLFRQLRPGAGGIPFELWKLRTMRDGDGSDAERLTGFGKFLRSCSIDELPELLHVISGKMSLVGPRPLLMRYLPLYTQEQRRRHGVRPGITGWAQVNGRNTVSWHDKFVYDVWYVDHRSLWLDIKILARTVWMVLSRQGISADGEATMGEFTGEQEPDR